MGRLGTRRRAVADGAHPSSWWHSALALVSGTGERSVTVAAAAMVAVVFVLELAQPVAVTLGAFYVIPVGWVAWRTGWIRTVVACALVTVLVVVAAAAGRVEEPTAVSQVLAVAVIAVTARVSALTAGRFEERAVALQRTEAALRHSEERFRAMVQHSSDLILILERDATLRYGSPAAERMLGRSPTEMVGECVLDLVHPDDIARIGRALAQTLARPGLHAPQEARVRHADGTWRYFEVFANNLLDDPAVAGIVVNCRDITHRRELEKRLSEQALHDALTGLANRSLFRDRLEHVVVTRGNRPAVVLFLDLDGFKEVNDSLGHSHGDELLVGVAGRLSEATRPEDLVARLGGDEFAILLEGAGLPEATRVADRVLNVMARPFGLAGQRIRIGLSIGIAARAAGETADDILRDADIAMYAAKARGKGQSAVFDPEMRRLVTARLATGKALRRALEHGELTVHYQPVVDLDTGGVDGVEALVRWNHPERGLVGPHEFLPLAERTGIVDEIDTFVLDQACRTVGAWRAQHPRLADLSLSVNLSGHRLPAPELVRTVAHTLVATGLPAPALIVEFTEKSVMHNLEGARATIRRLRALGIRVAIDNFGTTYPSLHELRRLDIDVLKVDRSFVVDAGRGHRDELLANVVVNLGHVLGVTTVAEGVETAEQIEGLRAMGCHKAQGFRFARPVDAASMERELVGETPARMG